jgi:transposase
MKWDFKENRVAVAVTALHKCGKSSSQIFKFLKPLKISRNFVYRAIQHYKELWGVEDRAQSGRLRSVRAEAAIKTVRERIRRDPLWKQKIMSRELNISTQSSRASSGTIYT